MTLLKLVRNALVDTLDHVDAETIDRMVNRCLNAFKVPREDPIAANITVYEMQHRYLIFKLDMKVNGLIVTQPVIWLRLEDFHLGTVLDPKVLVQLPVVAFGGY